MSRRNLRGSWGESQRLTLRLTGTDFSELDDLAQNWGCDRSEALRRALRQAGVLERERRRKERLDALPTMRVAQLRELARQLRLTGRSKMTKADLRQALEARLTR